MSPAQLEQARPILDEFEEPQPDDDDGEGEPSEGDEDENESNDANGDDGDRADGTADMRGGCVLEHDDPAATVLEIHPADDALFVVTKACPAAHALGVQRRERRCLHRVDFRTPLAERLGSTPQA